MRKKKIIFNSLIILSSILLSLPLCFGGVIFSDNYNSVTDGWSCVDAIPPGYTGQSSCSYETIDTVTHYYGEITSGGCRSGNCLKLWRHNGGFKEYGGYLDKNFTEVEFNNHYKELYVRWYVKISPDWDANLATAQTHKLNRFYYGPTVESKAHEMYLDVKGSTTFKTSRISIYPNAGLGWAWYISSNITELGLNDGNWHSIEVRFKIDPNVGGFQVWIDGVAMNICDGSGNNCGTNHTNINTGGADDYFTSTLPPAIGNLTDGTWNFPTNGWYAFMFDDYVVSTDYIGPLGGSTTITRDTGTTNLTIGPGSTTISW